MADVQDTLDQVNEAAPALAALHPVVDELERAADRIGAPLIVPGPSLSVRPGIARTQQALAAAPLLPQVLPAQRRDALNLHVEKIEAAATRARVEAQGVLVRRRALIERLSAFERDVHALYQLARGAGGRLPNPRTVAAAELMDRIDRHQQELAHWTIAGPDATPEHPVGGIALGTRTEASALAEQRQPAVTERARLAQQELDRLLAHGQIEQQISVGPSPATVGDTTVARLVAAHGQLLNRDEQNVFYNGLATKGVNPVVALRHPDGRVLIAKPTYKGGWTLVGGLPEENESPLDGAMREVRHETGLDLDAQRFFLIGVHYVPAKDGRNEYVQLVFGVRLTAAEAARVQVPTAELAEFRFVPIEGLPGYALGPDDRMHAAHRMLQHPGSGIYVESDGPTLLPAPALASARGGPAASRPPADASPPAPRRARLRVRLETGGGPVLTRAELNAVYNGRATKGVNPVVAVLHPDGRVLIAKPTYKGGWTLIGGLGDEHESPRDGAIREARHETGLDLDPGRFWLIGARYVPAKDGRNEYVQLVFGVRLTAAEAARVKVPSAELSEFRFVPVHDLPDYAVGPDDRMLAAHRMLEQPASGNYQENDGPTSQPEMGWPMDPGLGGASAERLTRSDERVLDGYVARSGSVVAAVHESGVLDEAVVAQLVEAFNDALASELPGVHRMTYRIQKNLGAAARLVDDGVLLVDEGLLQRTADWLEAEQRTPGGAGELLEQAVGHEGAHHKGRIEESGLLHACQLAVIRIVEYFGAAYAESGSERRTDRRSPEGERAKRLLISEYAGPSHARAKATLERLDQANRRHAAAERTARTAETDLKVARAFRPADVAYCVTQLEQAQKELAVADEARQAARAAYLDLPAERMAWAFSGEIKRRQRARPAPAAIDADELQQRALDAMSQVERWEGTTAGPVVLVLVVPSADDVASAASIIETAAAGTVVFALTTGEDVAIDRLAAAADAPGLEIEFSSPDVFTRWTAQERWLLCAEQRMQETGYPVVVIRVGGEPTPGCGDIVDLALWRGHDAIVFPREGGGTRLTRSDLDPFDEQRLFHQQRAAESPLTSEPVPGEPTAQVSRLTAALGAGAPVFDLASDGLYDALRATPRIERYRNPEQGKQHSEILVDRRSDAAAIEIAGVGQVANAVYYIKFSRYPNDILHELMKSLVYEEAGVTAPRVRPVTSLTEMRPGLLVEHVAQVFPGGVVEPSPQAFENPMAVVQAIREGPDSHGMIREILFQFFANNWFDVVPSNVLLQRYSQGLRWTSGDFAEAWASPCNPDGALDFAEFYSVDSWEGRRSVWTPRRWLAMVPFGEWTEAELGAAVDATVSAFGRARLVPAVLLRLRTAGASPRQIHYAEDCLALLAKRVDWVRRNRAIVVESFRLGAVPRVNDAADGTGSSHEPTGYPMDPEPTSRSAGRSTPIGEIRLPFNGTPQGIDAGSDATPGGPTSYPMDPDLGSAFAAEIHNVARGRHSILFRVQAHFKGQEWSEGIAGGGDPARRRLCDRLELRGPSVVSHRRSCPVGGLGTVGARRICPAQPRCVATSPGPRAPSSPWS
jgi:8-oxo-dGTP pyrophosphatase MutT (NUDIX family)